MTHISTNNKCLKTGISQNLTDYEKHYSPSLDPMSNFTAKVMLTFNPTPDTFL